MSHIKISIEVEQLFLETEKASQGVPHTQIRLMSSVVFVNQNKRTLSKPYSGILDTGAPITVIPHSIWKDIYVRKLTKRYLSGINPEKQCKILCDIGGILLQLVDENDNRSSTFPCLAYLVPAQYDTVPLILGVDRCLDRFKLEVNFVTQHAYLIYLSA